MTGRRNSASQVVADNAEMYRLPDSSKDEVVSRIQLQRLLDEEDTLCLLLGTRKAIDVIRQFKLGEHERDPVAALSENLIELTQGLERSGANHRSRRLGISRT